MKDVRDVNAEERKQRPNLLDPAGPITSGTLKTGLEQIDAEKFDEAWRSFCLLAEQIDFVYWTVHFDGAPDIENYQQVVRSIWNEATH